MISSIIKRNLTETADRKKKNEIVTPNLVKEGGFKVCMEGGNLDNEEESLREEFQNLVPKYVKAQH